MGAPARPVENVTTLVSRLRSWLGPAVVEGHREGYRIGPDADVDLARAERLTERAEQPLTDGHSGVGLVPAEQAGKLLNRGAVLEDEPYAAWAEPVHRDGLRPGGDVRLPARHGRPAVGGTAHPRVLGPGMAPG